MKIHSILELGLKYSKKELSNLLKEPSWLFRSMGATRFGLWVPL